MALLFIDAINGFIIFLPINHDLLYYLYAILSSQLLMSPIKDVILELEFIN